MRGWIALTAAGLLGCGSAGTSDKPSSSAEAVCGDPADAAPADGCGVFVSSSLGNDVYAGTRELPVRSLEKALFLAQDGAKRVYACAETFVEPVVVPSGVTIWGGFDCGDDWTYVGQERKTTLSPGPDVVPLHFLEGEAKAVVANLRAVAADATEPGGSSIAAIVGPDAVVEILRSELIAGNAADGLPGESGGEEPATPGIVGTDGAPACTGAPVPGAPAVVLECGDSTSVGARGGDGGINSGENGENGLPAPSPNPSKYGFGGTGMLTSGYGCRGGQPGYIGDPGVDGLGATGPGFLGLDGWEGQHGEDGGIGRPGQGGGGGGGSRAGIVYCGVLAKGGASGGSGGTGGCGGRGGKGGGSGGASIGMLSLTAGVTIRATTIVTGRGGDGGRGGLGQIGGHGGSQGHGGLGYNGSRPACEGGGGGKGGDGGLGGGGLGGPSVGIAHVLGETPGQQDVTFHTGSPGKGGRVDPLAEPTTSTSGEDGVAGDVLGFPAR